MNEALYSSKNVHAQSCSDECHQKGDFGKKRSKLQSNLTDIRDQVIFHQINFNKKCSKFEEVCHALINNYFYSLEI